jgi:hypothetical protein
MCTEQIKKIDNWERVSPSGYLPSFFNEISYIEQHKVVVNNLCEAQRIKGLLGAGGLSNFKSIKNLHYGFDWYGQEVDFVPSNLGRGFIWYFLCNKCQRRAKFLYYRQFYGYSNEPLCRLCYGLKYAQQNRKGRQFSVVKK